MDKILGASFNKTKPCITRLIAHRARAFHSKFSSIQSRNQQQALSSVYSLLNNRKCWLSVC